MKLTLDVPDDVVREMKLRAALQKRTVKAVATELFRDGLGLKPEPEPERFVSDRIEINEYGVPIIRCRSGAQRRR